MRWLSSIEIYSAGIRNCTMKKGDIRMKRFEKSSFILVWKGRINNFEGFLIVEFHGAANKRPGRYKIPTHGTCHETLRDGAHGPVFNGNIIGSVCILDEGTWPGTGVTDAGKAGYEFCGKPVFQCCKQMKAGCRGDNSKFRLIEK